MYHNHPSDPAGNELNPLLLVPFPTPDTPPLRLFAHVGLIETHPVADFIASPIEE